MDHTLAEDIVWEASGSEHFTGQVRFGLMHEPDDSDDLRVLGVHFDPGARTDWHWHPGGQVLHVTEGVGLVVNESGSRVRVSAGDTVYSPPGELHWHGASNHSHMVHLSLTWNGVTQWEPRKVTDTEYGSE